jgi:hypothetical protein
VQSPPPSAPPSSSVKAAKTQQSVLNGPPKRDKQSKVMPSHLASKMIGESRNVLYEICVCCVNDREITFHEEM